MLQRQSNAHKLGALRITGVWSSFVSSRHKHANVRTFAVLLWLTAEETLPSVTYSITWPHRWWPYLHFTCYFSIYVHSAFLFFLNLFLQLCHMSSICCPWSFHLSCTPLLRLLCCFLPSTSLSHLLPPCRWRPDQCFSPLTPLPSPCFYSPPSLMWYQPLSRSLSPPVSISPSLTQESRDGIGYPCRLSSHELMTISAWSAPLS